MTSSRKLHLNINILSSGFHGASRRAETGVPDVLPDGLKAFVEHAVPILRGKGIFREAHEGSTLRDRFGLARPVNRYTAARAAAE